MKPVKPSDMTPRKILSRCVVGDVVVVCLSCGHEKYFSFTSHVPKYYTHCKKCARRKQ